MRSLCGLCERSRRRRHALCGLVARSRRRRRSEFQELVLHLLEREAVGERRRRRRLDLPRELGDRSLQIGIVARERQRRAVLRERRGKLAAAMMNFGDAADGCEIFGCALEDRRELGQRLVELVQLDQRTAEGDAGREIRRVYREAGATDVNRFLVLPRPPAFFGELREGDRRRILLDPASKIFDPLTVGHSIRER